MPLACVHLESLLHPKPPLVRCSLNSCYLKFNIDGIIFATSSIIGIENILNDLTFVQFVKPSVALSTFEIETTRHDKSFFSLLLILRIAFHFHDSLRQCGQMSYFTAEVISISHVKWWQFKWTHWWRLLLIG